MGEWEEMEKWENERGKQTRETLGWWSTDDDDEHAAKKKKK